MDGNTQQQNARWRKYHLKHLAEAISRTDTLRFPADSVLRQFFRECPTLGQRDRALIAEGAFAFLRYRRSLKTLAQTTQKQRLALITLVRVLGLAMGEVKKLADDHDQHWLEELPERLAFSLTEIEAADVSDDLWARLGHDYSDEQRLALVKSWHQPAPFDLRVNIMKTTRDEALTALRREGLCVEATPFSPYGLRVHGRPMLVKHPWLQDGSLEVQSESSQLAGMLLMPKRGEMIADFCAGAGGKTLLLGMIMHSKGRLYAFDISEKRLQKLAPRLARSGLSNVHPQRLSSENDGKIKRLSGKMDRVLVDAPCTGTGTLQRNPDLKWRYSESHLRELNEKQTAILASAARLVKPGGRLVYATCSVLKMENEVVIESFLEKHRSFQLCDANILFSEMKVPLDTGKYLNLFPGQHNTDGFFAAVLERVSAS